MSLGGGGGGVPGITQLMKDVNESALRREITSATSGTGTLDLLVHSPLL